MEEKRVGLRKMVRGWLTRLVLPILLVSVVLLMSSCLPARAPVFEGLMVEEAYNLIQKNQGSPNFVIIDIRLSQLFAKGHIEGAINLDYHAENFRDEHSKMNKKKTYLIYDSCSCGGIGWKALEVMKELGFRRVYNMWQGFQEWEEAGLPSVK